MMSLSEAQLHEYLFSDAAAGIGTGTLTAARTENGTGHTDERCRILWGSEQFWLQSLFLPQLGLLIT